MASQQEAGQFRPATGVPDLPADFDGGPHQQLGHNRPPFPSDWRSRASNITIIFGPDAFFRRGDLAEILWEAQLLVKSREVPKLMRHGFFWGEANIMREEGSLFQIAGPLPPVLQYMGWTHCRCYSLRDLGDDPSWYALLVVYAREIPTLRDFRPGMLSVDRVARARAWNWDCKTVYRFDWDNPNTCFNALFDDMPLEGWWPWPKRQPRLVAIKRE